MAGVGRDPGDGVRAVFLADDAGSRKSLLTPEQLVARLKAKGVTFDRCTEAEAADYLAHANNYLRAASYRKLYPVRAEGERAGEYIGLDFEALRRLASADRALRSALREIVIDVEHFARARLLDRAIAEGEDSYTIVADYLADLSSRDRSRITGALSWRARRGTAHDEYSGDLIAHYQEQGFPLWLFLEVIEFGKFKDPWLYCAKRWDDRDMLVEHYTLKSAGALRNAVCHNRCLINGFSSREPDVDFETPATVLASMNLCGIRNGKTRRRKMANPRIAQIASVLYLSCIMCTRETTRARHADVMADAVESLTAAKPFCPADGSLGSYFDFIIKLVDIWVPGRA